MKPRICMIGCGKMGQAMLSGWIAAEDGLSADDFCVVEHSLEKCASLSGAYGVPAFDSLDEACAQVGPFRMYILAVKPQVMPQVLENLAQLLQTAETSGSAELAANPLVVSIVAGITTQKIDEALAGRARIIRVMPNTPLEVGAGATVVAAGPRATQEDVDEICGMFAQLGMAEAVSESQIDAACALSGGGPAYTALMIEALTSAGAAQGLSPKLAQKLALQTVYGTCKLMDETGSTPEQTRVAVCSPGGTTLAALAAMEGEPEPPSAAEKPASAAEQPHAAKNASTAEQPSATPSPMGFTDSIRCGVTAAVARAKELASC